jgi:hypothetical protein
VHISDTVHACDSGQERDLRVTAWGIVVTRFWWSQLTATELLLHARARRSRRVHIGRHTHIAGRREVQMARHRGQSNRIGADSLSCMHAPAAAARSCGARCSQSRSRIRRGAVRRAACNCEKLHSQPLLARYNCGDELTMAISREGLSPLA